MAETSETFIEELAEVIPKLYLDRPDDAYYVADAIVESGIIDRRHAYLINRAIDMAALLVDIDEWFEKNRERVTTVDWGGLNVLLEDRRNP